MEAKKLNDVKLAYKKWVTRKGYLTWYGDFDNAEKLTFEVRNGEESDYIFVGHPDGAEDYGEGENGGVNGFISPINEFFKGLFKNTIPYPSEEDWSETYKTSRRALKLMAEKYGLVLDIFSDIETCRPRIRGKEFMEFCSPTELEKYVNFFSEVSKSMSFDEEMSYFTWSICGHDDYYTFEEVDGEWFVFWITRYNPNF